MRTCISAPPNTREHSSGAAGVRSARRSSHVLACDVTHVGSPEPTRSRRRCLQAPGPDARQAVGTNKPKVHPALPQLYKERLCECHRQAVGVAWRNANQNLRVHPCGRRSDPRVSMPTFGSRYGIERGRLPHRSLIRLTTAFVMEFASQEAQRRLLELVAAARRDQRVVLTKNDARLCGICALV